jgi:dsRNA-specific ribonuclease
MWYLISALPLLIITINIDAAPLNWTIQSQTFERVYKPHPKCSTGEMTEMECANFRSRALKRFQKEWASNAYWRDGQEVENAKADHRVNSELNE